MSAIAIFQHQSISGSIHFSQKRKDSPVILKFCLKGIHEPCALHIHEYGDTSDGCRSLGGHFNPTKKKHGQHAGDVIFNVFPDSKGNYNSTFITKELSLQNGNPHNIVGRSVVIHAFQDDYGKKGREDSEGKFVPYKKMSDYEIQYYTKMSGYKQGTRQEMVSTLEKGSLETGNAGGRVAYAIIALSK
jgi:superoxide dismutase, Cu-Zn family